MTSPRDLRALVRMAQEAEDAGADAVMVSEHVVLGPAAAEHGLMANPREYALPGNQDPATPWPSSLILLAAMAAVTTPAAAGGQRRDRAASPPAAPGQAAGHPRPAVGGPAGGAADGQLAPPGVRGAGRAVRRPRPAAGRAPGGVAGAVGRLAGVLPRHARTGSTTCTWSPSRSAPTAPGCGSGESRCTRGCCAGWSSTGTVSTRWARPPTPTWSCWQPAWPPTAGRWTSWRWWGARAAASPGPDAVADLDRAFDSVPAQLARGFSSICFKPSQYLRRPARGRPAVPAGGGPAGRHVARRLRAAGSHRYSSCTNL